MIVDTSVVMAITLKEPEAARFASIIADAEGCYISSGSVMEFGIVCLRRIEPISLLDCDALIRSLGLAIIPVDAEQTRIGWDAYARFGKGRHPAALNFGDCFSYALSKARNEPLLFKGDDFAKTDVWAVG